MPERRHYYTCSRTIAWAFTSPLCIQLQSRLQWVSSLNVFALYFNYFPTLRRHEIHDIRLGRSRTGPSRVEGVLSRGWRRRLYDWLRRPGASLRVQGELWRHLSLFASPFKAELDQLLTDEQIINVPVLILGNKIDKPGACSEEQLRQFFQLCTTGKGQTSLAELNTRPLELFMCSVLKKQGYGEGFRWLANYINWSFRFGKYSLYFNDFIYPG